MPQTIADVSIVGYRLVPPDQLLANPRNPRRHPNAQREALRASLRQLGWIAPVIQNVRTGHLLDGHARIEEALSADVAAVPVVDVDLSEEQEALALASFDPITALAVLDRQALDDLLREVDTGEAALQQLLTDVAKGAGLEYGAASAAAPEPQLDRAAELQAQWDTALGQLWVIPSATVPGRAHRLLCGDSTDAATVARLMDGARAAIMLSDPPYNVGFEYAGASRDDRGPQEYAAFCARWLALGAQVSAMQIITPGKGNTRLYEPVEWLTWFKRFGLSHGHFFKAMVTEPIGLFGEKPTGKFYATDYFDFPTDREPGLGDLHGCPKPVGLWRALLEPMTARGDSVYDAFIGSGTSLVVAEQTGRLCYGLEIEPKYVAVALQRCADLGLRPERADG